MTGNSLDQEQAIAAAVALMNNYGYVYGPCLRATPVGIAGSGVWKFEFAHIGFTGPSPTSDPPTMEITMAIDEGRACFLDQWWNRKSH
jgi:hypothetical protein